MADPPPSWSMSARSHNLPAQVTPLLGREHALQSARGLLRRDNVRLVTLTGPGGSGKTRLGLQAAADLLDRFEDGVCFVDLSPISDPALGVSTIARTLGLWDTASRPLLDVMIDFLRERQLLLLLDNFEQILPVASTVADLLRLCPRLSVLVTSRGPLQIDGEHEFPVPPLALPDPACPMTPDRLAESPAIELFVERAAAVRPEFVLTSESAPVVAEICTRLDGLPLAIELAAARIRVMSPQAIRSRLGQSLGLLTSGRRDLPARQRTLRNTIAWSHDLLGPAEQILFRRLGVFVGGFTLDAAEAVCDADGTLGIDMLDGVSSLVEMSMLRAEGASGELRFSMLETIREYALERLEQSHEIATVRRSHARYSLTLAEEAEPHVLRADDGPWLGRLHTEHDNLRAVLHWCLVVGGDGETGIRVVAALARFWQIRSYLGEGLRWIDLALARDDEALAGWRATALARAGWLVHNLGEVARAGTMFEEAASIFRRLGDRHGLALALGDLGIVLEYQGEYERGTALMAESRALYEEIGDLLGVADRLRDLGSVACAQRDFVRATALLEENLALCRAHGGSFRIGLALGALGLSALYQGLVDRALETFEECLTWHRKIEHTYGIAWVLHYLGRIALLRDDVDQAADQLAQSLNMRMKLNDGSGIAQCLEGIAAVGLARRLPESAVRLCAVAARLREEIAMPLSPAERISFERDLVAVRAEVSEEAFAALWAEGRALTLHRAVEIARGVAQAVEANDQPASDHRTPASRISALTPREHEVVTLIARGMTNPEIAAALVIAPRTADTHVRNILGKLDLANRAQIAVWASRQGLG